MYYDMYSKNHAQDVTVAATYMSWNIWVLHLDSYLGYNHVLEHWVLHLDSILDIINTSVVQYLNF